MRSKAKSTPTSGERRALWYGALFSIWCLNASILSDRNKKKHQPSATIVWYGSMVVLYLEDYDVLFGCTREDEREKDKEKVEFSSRRQKGWWQWCRYRGCWWSSRKSENGHYLVRTPCQLLFKQAFPRIAPNFSILNDHPLLYMEM